jgi:chromosome segregation ATPase
MASQLQASETQYRDKLAQLESDYNSAIAYLKSTEKMLKKLKDEQASYKAENKKLKTDVEDLEEKAAKASSAAAAPSGWEKERGSLQKKIETLQGELRDTSNQLQKRLASISAEVDSAKRERDVAVKTADEAMNRIALNRRDLEQLQHENAGLEQRAQDAEQKVALLLDQVETSVDNYRRRSRQVPSMNSELTAANGGHVAHARNDSSEVESVYGPGGIDARNSVALDNLANELETLRTHWESNNKNYRLSNAFDFETSIGARKEDDPNGLGLSESLADWRKRLDVEEKGSHGDAKSKTRPA